MHFIDNKRILVTGACGSVGSELVKMLLESSVYSPDEVIGIDHNESELFFLDQRYLDKPQARFVVADVRDRDKLVRIMRGIDVVFHCAALKHVVLCERSPFEAVQTNIHGVQNIIFAAYENKVERVLFTSTDKAVNPTNVMGTSKLMGERLMTAANSNTKDDGPIYASTRFGNVLGSTGSVLPIFTRQIMKGGPVTLTDPGMTRFIMSIQQAVELVIDSAALARGGDVFITKMPVIRIEDLAQVMIDELASSFGHKPEDIEIRIIGSKPGEKLYEELMSNEETRRAVELENYFAILPAFRGLYRNIQYDYPDLLNQTVTNPYISSDEEAFSRNQLSEYLRQSGLLEIREEEHPDKRYWPGDK
jgi:FlaA1/EpsC-like NDP-sugar epimerase